MRNRIISFFLAGLMVFSILYACSSADKPLTAAELLSLGDKFLLDLDYEQALVQFLQVIEIEPRNPRGYTGAAEAYVGLGQPENARAILEQGLSAVGQEDRALLEEILSQIDEALLDDDTNPEGFDDDIVVVPEPLALQEGSPFGFIGASPEDLTALLGTYDGMTQGDDGNLFQYGHVFVAYDRDDEGEPDGFAYLVIASLADLIGHESGDAVEVSALDELFGQTGETEPGTLVYTYQGIDAVMENIPADGVVPIDHVVIMSTEPRPPEPEPTPTPAPTPPPRSTDPTPTPEAPTPTPTPDLAPIPAIPEDYYEEYDIDLDVLRP